MLLSIGSYNGWRKGLTYVCSLVLQPCADTHNISRIRARQLLQPRAAAADARITVTSKSLVYYGVDVSNEVSFSLHQFLNGWIQNINAYDQGLRLGKYFNLDVCP